MNRAGARCALLLAAAALVAGCAARKPAPEPRVVHEKRPAPAPEPIPPRDFAGFAARAYGDSALGDELSYLNGAGGDLAIPPGLRLDIPGTRDELLRRVATIRAETAYNRATRFARAKRYTEAEASFREALRERPGMHEAAYNLGIILGQMGRSAEAGTMLAKAVELEGSNARYRYAWGSSLRRAGKTAEAERQFARACELDPAYKDAVFALAATREALGKESTPLYRRYLELDPNGPWAEEARRRIRLGSER